MDFFLVKENITAILSKLAILVYNNLASRKRSMKFADIFRSLFC